MDNGEQPWTFDDENFGNHGRWRTLVDMSAAISSTAGSPAYQRGMLNQ
jgi:hypothetical protein